MGIETLAIASIGSAIVGTGVSAIGAINQSAAQSAAQTAQGNQLAYQAQVARYNQQIMERNASLAEERGRIAEQNKRLQTGQMIGSQRAALAAQGADVNTGSPLDIQKDTAQAGEYDAATIRSNAAYEAYGYRLQGWGAGSNASLLQAGASNSYAAASRTAGMLPFTLGATLLSGASSVANKWSGYKMAGIDPFGGGGGGYTGSTAYSGGSYGASI